MNKQTMNKKIIYSLVALAVVFFAASLIVFISKSSAPAEKKKPQPVKQKAKDDEIKTEFVKVKAFFLTETSKLMRPVQLEIPAADSKEKRYREFLELILKGQETMITPVPEGVTLRSLYFIANQNMLVVDFSDELLRRFPGGTRGELEFIYFIVNNLCYNFDDIQRVKFLIAGNEYRTISGHIDIQNPFYPDFKYLYLKE
jgi:spore germination protein GerM